ncbi:ABC transporter ATP-binding protein [Kitasatospora phosalacinea]|uniref:ABC transporter ATP-binding protein n=1 Tax=Kitasatospora phosalacinea TaxID=2065 RepID=UPI00365F8725
MTEHTTPRPPDTADRPGLDVELSGVRKAFGTREAAITAADDVSLRIEPGSTVALVGPSGSGKSTLLHLVGAIEQADAGTITVGGTDITTANRRALAAYRRSLGFVFQRFHLLPALTVRDNVLAPLLPDRKALKEALPRVHDLLTAVGLDGRADALPAQLSGGQQQRVAIARALIGRPGLLLADEPTGNLDSATGERIVAELVDPAHRRGATLLIATHDPALAARCSRILRVRDGRIVEDTRPDAH